MEQRMIEIGMLLFAGAVVTTIAVIVARAVRATRGRGAGDERPVFDADRDPDHDQGSGFDPSDR
jgi:hypothetical protein